MVILLLRWVVMRLVITVEKSLVDACTYGVSTLQGYFIRIFFDGTDERGFLRLGLNLNVVVAFPENVFQQLVALVLLLSRVPFG